MCIFDALSFYLCIFFPALLLLRYHCHIMYVSLRCTTWFGVCIYCEMICCCLVAKSYIRLLVTPWPIACQTPLSMGFPRQEYCSGLPFPSPGDRPDSGIQPASPALAGRFFITEPWNRVIKSLASHRKWIAIKPRGKFWVVFCVLLQQWALKKKEAVLVKCVACDRKSYGWGWSQVGTKVHNGD